MSIDTTGPVSTDGFDYDSDGLPFDAPIGYDPGDYWLREQLLNGESQAEVDAAWAWEPDAIDTGRVLARLRRVLTDSQAEGIELSDPSAFSPERVGEAAMRCGFGYAQGRRLEKALYDCGHVVIVRFDIVESIDGEPMPVPTYALAEA